MIHINMRGLSKALSVVVVATMTGSVHARQDSQDSERTYPPEGTWLAFATTGLRRTADPAGANTDGRVARGSSGLMKSRRRAPAPDIDRALSGATWRQRTGERKAR